MAAKMEQTLATNTNFVLSVDRNGCVLYSNEADNPLLNEWGVEIGEKLPSHIGDIVHKVISRNSPERIEVKVGIKVYLVVFQPLPEQGCVYISGFDISDQKELEEELQLRNEELELKSRELSKVKEELIKSESKYWNIIENAQEGIWILDRNDQTIYVNKKVSEMLGYNIDEIIGQLPQKFLASEFRSVADDRLQEHRQRIGKAIDYRFIRKNGSDLWCIVSTHQLFDDEGKYAGSMGMLIDITEHKRTEETLAFERSQLLSIFDSMEDVVYVADPYTHEILYANKSLKEMFNKQLVGGICYQEFQRKGYPCNSCTNPRILEEIGKPYHWEYYNPNLNSYFLKMDRIIKWPDGRNVRFEIAKDITEHKQAEEALKKAHDTLEEKIKERTQELENAYKLLKESKDSLAEAQRMAHIGNWVWDIEADRAYWSEEMYRIFKRDPQKLAPSLKEYLSYIHPDDLDYYCNETFLSKKENTSGFDFRIVIADREERTLHIKSEFIFNNENIPIRVKGTVQDITDRKRSEEKLRESEEKYRNIVETSNEGIGLIDNELKITFVNKKIEDVIGYSIKEIIGRTMWDFISEESKPIVKSILERGLQDFEKPELKFIRKDGSSLWAQVNAKPIFDNDGKFMGIMTMLADITTRKNAEEALKNIEIARKKEIHHRIKNNLQVISSLLDLQADKIKHKKNISKSEFLEAFKESQDRVISMALIHEELHKGGQIDTLNVSNYIEDLADNLLLSYRVGNDVTSLNMDIDEDIFFDMDTAVPLGIIINELISNSLKHAFPNRDKGETQIKLHRENEECKIEDSKNTNFVLSVSDNGIGISKDLDIENLDSLGLQLVTTLVEQLDGELDLKRDNGTEFIIRFNVTGNTSQEITPDQMKIANNEL